MNPSQIPYDHLDWLQIAIYFVALPIVAFLGAALGLGGRIRRGGLLWSTNVGLLGGAVACLVIALPLRQLVSDPFDDLLSLYEKNYRWQMLAAAWGGTGGCAFVAALAWRWLHAPAEVASASFSLRQILIVQCLCFISLGSFVSLRQSMLAASNSSGRMQQYWTNRFWKLNDDQLSMFSTAEIRTMAELEQAVTAQHFSDMGRMLPNLRQANFTYHGNWKVDFDPLFHHQGLRHLGIELIAPQSNLLKGFSTSKVEQLILFGDVANLDFAPINDSTSLESLLLEGTARRSQIETLRDAQSLRELSIYDCKFASSDLPILSWPREITALFIGKSNLQSRDILGLANHPNLETVRIDDLVLDQKEIAAILTLPHLKSAHFTIGPLSEPVASLFAAHPSLELSLGLANDNLLPAEIEKLAQFKNLEGLYLDLSPHGDEILAEVIKLKTLTQVSIASPNISPAAMLNLASMERLEVLRYPQHLSATTFVREWDARRDALKLPPVRSHWVKPPATSSPNSTTPSTTTPNATTPPAAGAAK